MYASYTAASFVRKQDLAVKNGVNLEGALTWAFEFEDQPYFAGFRVLASNDIDLPVLNVFRMFAKMKGTRLETKSKGQLALNQVLEDSVRSEPDVGATATLDKDHLAIFIWHYHDDDLPGNSADVKVVLKGLTWPADAQNLCHYRIDADHSNAYTKWKAMGSPQTPSETAYAELVEAAKLTELNGETRLGTEDESVTLSFSLPRQAVSLIVLNGVWQNIPRQTS
jgi:xylan 1,4-beta-xylosidase